MKRLIAYFTHKHLFTNFLFIAILAGGVIFWNQTGKEDMPNMTMDFARIRASYSGATPEEIDLYVTTPIEEAIEGIDGILEIRSSSGYGNCSLFIELDRHSTNRPHVVDEIKDAMHAVRLPEEVETPQVREFKSSQRSVLDFVLYYRDTPLLSVEKRRALQNHCDTLADRLSRLPVVSEVSLGGELEEYIEVRLKPEKLIEYNISVSEITNVIRRGDIRQPVGSLADEQTTRIRVIADLSQLEQLRNLIIRSNFEGTFLRLRELADVERVFTEQNSFFKVNGNEAVRINIVKTSSVGILEAVDKIKALADEYATHAFAGTDIEMRVLADNSESVRNRLSLIAGNGLLGFLLIIVILFIFLDARSGLWVAMGIPFSLGCTMILSSLLGHTINNMTLAGVIIVLGMVVDDAIVVAENITRLRYQGLLSEKAVVEGTANVFSPILASITTTCVAFVPLFFFHGRFGQFVQFIPPIIFLMLGGSLLESLFILPSHMLARFPRWVRIVLTGGLILLWEKSKSRTIKNSGAQAAEQNSAKTHWFMAVENAYGRFLNFALRYKLIIYILLGGLLVYAGWVFTKEMKFSMFPREETTELFLSGSVLKGKDKFDTEKQVRSLERIFAASLGKEVVGFRTSIARGRRGDDTGERGFSIQVEILPKDKREKTTNQLIAAWEEQMKELPGFSRLSFARSRFGQDSGSTIDILIQESNNDLRREVAEEVYAYLQSMPAIVNPEIERTIERPQFNINLNQDLINRLNINADSITSTLRTILQGNTALVLTKDGEETDVVVTVAKDLKSSLPKILALPVQNASGYLVPLKKVVSVQPETSLDSISKQAGKRTLHVYGDLVNPEQQQRQGNRPAANTQRSPGNPPEAKGKVAQNFEKPQPETPVQKLDLPGNMTSLEVAAHLEQNLFPALARKYPTTQLSFAGEIEDSREAGNDFQLAIVITLLLIYMILALTLNSVFRPFIILLAIPFGCVGVILTLKIHGMLIYGFFSAVGALGLAGVIVNDSIVLLAKLDESFAASGMGHTPRERVANIAKTRLRAVLLTTVTTVAGLMPTAYGVFGYDSMLAEMMLVMAWGLIFGTLITLLFVPSIYCHMKELSLFFQKSRQPLAEEKLKAGTTE